MLTDILRIFSDQNKDAIGGENLTEELRDLPGSFWQEVGKHKKPLSAKGLSNMLKPLGISSKPAEVGNLYHKDDFQKEWAMRDIR